MKILVNEETILNHNNVVLDEDYPVEFEMEVFKKLDSFTKRVKYCQDRLPKIAKGSSRIVYKVDEEKVLKLAYNKKGIAQNEVEIEYSQYPDLKDIVAKVFDYHHDALWLEMELVTKVKPSDFKSIIGFTWEEFQLGVLKFGNTYNSRLNRRKVDIDSALYDRMWEDEFMSDIFQFIGDHGLPVGDMVRINSYGITRRKGTPNIVMVDYGLTSDVYDSFYS